MAENLYSQDDFVRADKFIKDNPDFLHEFCLEHLSLEDFDELIHRKEALTLEVSRRPNAANMYEDINRSVTANLYDDILKGNKKVTPSRSRKELEQLDESELFKELLREIAHELDVKQLCHKVLINVLILTKSDRSSLFLVRGNDTDIEKTLVSTLFDVREDSTVEDSLKEDADMLVLPFGKGIAGAVALTKQSIRIKDVYTDSRFNQEVDMKTGYRTTSLLCLPILNAESLVIGVAQIMNKADGEEYTDHDEEKFRKYLAFAGVGIMNAQLFEMSVTECRQNQILLSSARSIFVHQTNQEQLIQKILLDSLGLIDCQRCILYLRNVHTSPKVVQFVRMFDMLSEYKPLLVTRTSADGHLMTTQNANQVISTAKVQTVNAEDDPKHLHEPIIDQDGFQIRNMISVPILYKENMAIGVIQLINKAKNAAFTEMDVNSIETFSLFCGLCIHNCQVFEDVAAMMARQTVHLEMLTFHATEGLEETLKLVKATVPKATYYRVYNWDFNDMLFDDFESCKIVIRMFHEMNVIVQYSINYEVLCRWTLSVKKNYRPVAYHNWRHGLNVAQTMFTLLYTADLKRFFADLTMFGLIVACLCHDLDHRGTNNAFQSEMEHPLAALYGTSTLEHHHFDQCILLLNNPDTAIFQSLSNDEYRSIVDVIEKAILSTDLSLYFKKKARFSEVVASRNTDWKATKNNELLRALMMTSCDVSAVCKPWDLQFKTAHLVSMEFFEQGDIERSQLGLEPLAMMDRERQNELPKMQLGFIDAVCIPVYKMLSEVEPKVSALLDGCTDNRKHWEQLTADYQRAIASAANQQKTKSRKSGQDITPIIKPFDSIPSDASPDGKTAENADNVSDKSQKKQCCELL